MKFKIIKALLLSGFITMSLLANNSDLKTKIENLPMIKSNKIKVMSLLTQNGVHQFKGTVLGKKGVIIEGFITGDLKTLMLGKAYDVINSTELVMPYDLDIKKLKSLAAYKTGNGKDEYFVFTDPECPYCQRLEKQIVSLKKNVTLYTILFPLNFHKNAKSMSRYILSRKTNDEKAKAMKEISNKSTIFQTVKYSEKERAALNILIDLALKEANRIGINSTPTILNAKGFKVAPQAVIK
ncbi:MAG: thioredoxin fold domain-containing protein [Campylobacterota bacterium]|nr:thioredoxin fold domain-containing protein [Campylobacterota bacterium]